MRGEHGTADDDLLRDIGSSPHARGTRSSVLAGKRGSGIIPACAGNTFFIGLLSIITRDHPRMRGEHATVYMDFEAAQGSSPHARGTH